jgi:hypothetical protein
VLQEQLQSLGSIPALQIQAHLHTMMNADAVRAVPLGTDAATAVAAVKAQCRDAPTLWEDRQCLVTRHQVALQLAHDLTHGEGATARSAYAARVLMAAVHCTAPDHAAYSSDIDYFLAKAASSSLSSPVGPLLVSIAAAPPSSVVASPASAAAAAAESKLEAEEEVVPGEESKKESKVPSSLSLLPAARSEDDDAKRSGMLPVYPELAREAVATLMRTYRKRWQDALDRSLVAPRLCAPAAVGGAVEGVPDAAARGAGGAVLGGGAFSGGGGYVKTVRDLC